MVPEPQHPWEPVTQAGPPRPGAAWPRSTHPLPPTHVPGAFAPPSPTSHPVAARAACLWGFSQNRKQLLASNFGFQIRPKLFGGEALINTTGLWRLNSESSWSPPSGLPAAEAPPTGPAPRPRQLLQPTAEGSSARGSPQTRQGRTGPSPERGCPLPGPLGSPPAWTPTTGAGPQPPEPATPADAGVAWVGAPSTHPPFRAGIYHPCLRGAGHPLSPLRPDGHGHRCWVRATGQARAPHAAQQSRKVPTGRHAGLSAPLGLSHPGPNYPLLSDSRAGPQTRRWPAAVPVPGPPLRAAHLVPVDELEAQDVLQLPQTDGTEVQGPPQGLLQAERPLHDAAQPAAAPQAQQVTELVAGDLRGKARH